MGAASCGAGGCEARAGCRPPAPVGAASDSGVERVGQRPDATTLWQQRGKRGGPGAVRLPSPVSGGHSALGARRYRQAVCDPHELRGISISGFGRDTGRDIHVDKARRSRYYSCTISVRFTVISTHKTSGAHLDTSHNYSGNRGELARHEFRPATISVTMRQSRTLIATSENR